MSDNSTDAELVVLAAANGLVIAPEHLPGVRSNFDLLNAYAALVEGMELPERLEPAFRYDP